MRKRKCGEIAGSSGGMYIRNIVDIPELSAIGFGTLEVKRLKTWKIYNKGK